MHRSQRIAPTSIALSRCRASAWRYNSTSSSQIPRKAITSILIANRGEIALRVGRTASKYGIRALTIYTDPDARSQHALSSPHAINLGHPSAYLDGDRIVAAAKEHGCVGVHPGYGFLSENSAFARKCTQAGLVFIGPPWEAMEAMGNKSRSKDIMIRADVPCIPGYHGSEQDATFLEAEAEKIGFPVLLKAVKGGGGKGMRIAMTPDVFHEQLQSARSEARSSFGDDVMLVEKYITTPRHIEVQIFADKYGNCVALGERDCSIQRRHQKIIEESPAPNLNESVRQDLWEKARAAALAVKYEGAGTVEFIFDNDTGNFFFMEMNTRLQVEHPVTEMITGEDLVLWQIIVAEGGRLPLSQSDILDRIADRGHAIEARIYAENPAMNFIPDSGALRYLQTPPTSKNVRLDTAVIAGDEISAHYDPMIAKLIVRGPTREIAIRKLHLALEQYRIAGVVTNIEFLKRVCNNEAFVAGEVETGFIPSNQATLFEEQRIGDEVYIQAALATLFSESIEQTSMPPFPNLQPGFAATPWSRRLIFHRMQPDGLPNAREILVEIIPTGQGLFDARVGSTRYHAIASQWDSCSQTVTSFFPKARYESIVIEDTSSIVVFQQGQRYDLQLAIPSWIEKIMGVENAAHSVLAPMPCKILQVHVQTGEEVMKDQILVVIESMKMETTIRSPQDGVISRIMHQAGDMCKAGTALVEFQDSVA